MDQNAYIEQAAAHFRTLLTEQLNRQERMAQGSPAKDFSRMERIVIGKPTQPNGQPSENLARVENFFNRWRKAHPEVPIEYYDERFTSVLAHRAMIDGGVKKKARRENKGLVDEISATIILQDFMQSRR